jgi:hypothetical protein
MVCSKINMELNSVYLVCASASRRAFCAYCPKLATVCMLSHSCYTSDLGTSPHRHSSPKESYLSLLDSVGPIELAWASTSVLILSASIEVSHSFYEYSRELPPSKDRLSPYSMFVFGELNVCNFCATPTPRIVVIVALCPLEER